MTHCQMLRYGMEQDGLSQGRLARETGLSKTCVSLVVNGKRRLSARMAVLFAQVLTTVSARELLIGQAEEDLRKYRECH